MNIILSRRFKSVDLVLDGVSGLCICRYSYGVLVQPLGLIFTFRLGSIDSLFSIRPTAGFHGIKRAPCLQTLV